MANINKIVDGKVIEMTDAEQAEYDERQKHYAELDKIAQQEQAKRLESQTSAKKKLKDLGLTDDEIATLSL